MGRSSRENGRGESGYMPYFKEFCCKGKQGNKTIVEGEL